MNNTSHTKTVYEVGTPEVMGVAKCDTLMNVVNIKEYVI